MTRYARTAGVSETPVDDELFVVLPGARQIFHLDPMATALWRALAEPAGAGELNTLFQAAFPDAPAARIEADLNSALGRLAADGLLVTLD